MRMLGSLVVLLMLGLGCGAEEERPDISVDGLHQECPDDGCAEGQTCVTAESPQGAISTCEIPCEADGDCPEGYRCRTPPVLPGELSDVCEAETE